MASSGLVEAVHAIKRISRLDVDDAQRPPVTADEVKELLSFAQSSDSIVLAKILEALGDLGRREVNRRTLTDSGVPELAVPHLTHADEEVQTYAVRVLANICFDSGQSSADAGRMKVESLGGVPMIVDMLRNVQNTKRLRMVLGCIGNLVSNTEHLAVAMQKALPVLSDCMMHPQVEISSMAVLAVSNMMVNEEMKILALKADVYSRLLAKLQNPDPNDICNVLTAISVFCETKPIADRFFNENMGFDLLFAVATENSQPDPSDEDEVEDSNAVIKATLGVLHDLAQINDDYRDIFLKHSGSIKTLFNFTKSRNLVLAEESSKVLAYLSLSTELNRNMLFEQVPIYLSWIKRSDSAELRLSAAMILGNLAEDETTASKLIESGAASAMIQELSRGLLELQSTESASMVEAAQNSEKEGKEMRIKHLCASGLKNLSIHPEHKLILLSQGIMSHLVALLQQRNEIVMHAALLLIKSLLVAGTPAVSAYLKSDPQAHILLSLTTKDEDNKKADHVFFEASRTIGVLLRSAEHETAAALLSTYSPLGDAPTNASGEVIVIDGKKYLSPYTALSNLIFSRFTVLQNEGAAVLGSLAMRDASTLLALVRIPDFVSHLRALLKRDILKIKDEELVRPSDNDQDTFPALSTLLMLILTSTDSEIQGRVHDADQNTFAKAVSTKAEDSRQQEENVAKFIEAIVALQK